MTGDAGALAHELPYWGWVDERTCLTRAGELVTVGALTPVVTDGRTAEDLDAVAGRWQRMLSGLPPEMRVSWIVERRQAAFDLRPPGTDIAGLAQRKRQAFLEGRLQDLDVHVVWSFDPGLRRTAGTRGRGWWRTYLAEWLRRRRAPHESVYLAADFARAVKTEAARVVDVTPVEILTAEKAAAVLYRLVNGGLGGWVPGMRTDAGVNWRLAGEDVAAERDVLHVGREQVGHWSCVAPPATVTANAFDELYALSVPMTAVVEWRPWSREAARRKLRSAQRHYFSKRYSMAAHMQEKEGTAAALEDAAASIEARRAGDALVELETEGVSYGEVALSVAVRGSANGGVVHLRVSARLAQHEADQQHRGPGPGARRTLRPGLPRACASGSHRAFRGRDPDGRRSAPPHLDQWRSHDAHHRQARARYERPVVSGPGSSGGLSPGASTISVADIVGAVRDPCQVARLAGLEPRRTQSGGTSDDAARWRGSQLRRHPSATAPACRRRPRGRTSSSASCPAHPVETRPRPHARRLSE